MAENEYISGLNILLQNMAQNQNIQTPTPEQAIEQQYDSEMQAPSNLGQIIQDLGASTSEDVTMNRYARGASASDIAADEYGKLDELNFGSAPDQQIIDPNAMIGSTGQRVGRALKAGWGDLLFGTGDAVDFVNAWVRPGDPDPSTSVGEWFKKIGTEYQNENVLILSEDLQDITWQDMFKGEFWSSKVSRLVPYALSFMIPYGGGYVAGSSLLGRFGVASAKALSKVDKAKKFGTLGKGINMGNRGIKGTGLMGKLAFDAGKKGIQPSRFMRTAGGFVGGGLAANLTEGAYLSGEAYNQMLHETDENGNPLFTPDEAANHAAGVMADNAKWAVIDMAQYGLLFGGIGKPMARSLLINPLKKTPFKASVRGLAAYTARKVLPLLPAAGAYASIEGITEGFQETYQEWAKYKNIQQAKGLDYDPATEWLKVAPFGEERPDLRDIFWSSVGLGVAMGGARGYFDAAAQRQSMIEDNIDFLNNNASMLEEAKTPDEQYWARQLIQDNIIAHNVLNYGGDGSVVIEYVNNMVKDNKMSQETADEYIQAVEQAEKNYEKHATNRLLTEEGAKQAFFRETRIVRNLSQQEVEKEAYKNDKETINKNVKYNDAEKQEALAEAEKNHLEVMETLKQDQIVLEREIEDIYTLRKDPAPTAESTGQRDKRYKVQGLTEQEIGEYSQEEAKKIEEEAKKKAAEEPTLVQKVIKGAKDLGTKAVEGAKGLFTKTKDKAQSPEVKEAIKKVKEYTKNEITPTAKEYLVKLLEAGKITAKAAMALVGTGLNKIINRGDVDKAAKKEERKKTKEETKEESQEDEKKKDKTEKVVPKTEQYQKTEEALKGKGIKVFSAMISKVQGKAAGAFSYMIKAASGQTIKFFANRKVDILKYTNTPQNIKLRLVEPVKGQADVVEVNGKLYFQYKKGAPLYESKIEVVVGDKVIGELEQAAKEFYEDKGPAKKAKKTTKKKDKRKIDQIIGAVKQTKENIKKFLNKSFKNIPAAEDVLINRNLEVYYDSGLGAAAITRHIVQKRFPGARGYVVQSKLTDDYGQEASSLALGAIVMINEDQVGQTDLIHELGHVYYGLMEDTPLMKRIKKLLPKSSLYQKTKREYPELILMNENGIKMTLGNMYKNILKNKPLPNEERIVYDIAKNIAKAEQEGNSTKSSELFNELRLQLKIEGVKDVRVDQQKHLLEETFTRTLESYSYGTIDAVLKGTQAQKQLEADLISFYKELKNLATDEEAKRLLDLSVDNIQSLDLEAAIKHILLDFNSGERTIPVASNSAYGAIKKANKKLFGPRATYAAVSMYIADFIGRNLTPTVMTNRVLKEIANDSSLKVTDVKQLREYVKAVIVQLTRPQDLKKADTILDKQLAAIGLKIKEVDNVTENAEQDPGAERSFDENEKVIALPTTTSNFIKKIVELYNHQNPDTPINRKKLLYDLYSLAKNNMYDPYNFIPALRKSDSNEIIAMLKVLDKVYGKDKVLTNAKLMEIKGPIEGINIEVLKHQALEIGYKGARRWKTYKTTSKTLEASVIRSIMKELKDNTVKGKEIADIYNELFYQKNPNDVNDRYSSAYKILDVILDTNPKGSLINKQALLQTEILYEGKRQYLWNIFFDHTLFKNGKPNLDNQSLIGIGKDRKFAMKVGKYEAKGLIHGKQGELKIILTEGLVASRAINYLSVVDNVEGDGVSVFNKENGLHNRAMNIANIINDEVIIDKNDIMHPDNNIYSDMLYNKKQRGVLTGSNGKVSNNPFNFTIHSGMMRHLIAQAIEKYEDRAAKLNNVTPNELIAGDFFAFLAPYNEGIKKNEKTIIYEQPIAVFSDKSRRYYIESIVAHDARTRKLLLSKIQNNPAYNAKYENGDRVFPFNIKNNKITTMPTLIKQFKNYIRENKELYQNNQDLNEVKNIDEALEAFLTSYIANKFMAQQMFVHDHRQSKNQVDYIKRAAGAIASHIVFDRNTMVEPVIIKDYYVDQAGKILAEETEGSAIENDAMGYILPEQAKFIRAKYGEVQKVGNVFKFVYHYTETEGKLKGKTTYLKFAVHTLTPAMEKKSPYLKNIGDILRKRQAQVKEMSGTPGNLVIAASESAAKLFLDGVRTKEHIYDVASSENIDEIMAKQDEIYTDENGYRGLSGEGFGIQLELDKESNERFFPSQLFYNLATNIETKEDQAIVDEMFALRKKVMEANNTSRNQALIMNANASEETVLNERDAFESSVSADIFGVLIDSVYSKLDPRYPLINAPHNSIATGRITHKGTKMFTKGSIAYQSASLGMGLKSYQRGLFKGDENLVVSEAIVPGYLRRQGVKKGDIFIGTRVPAHGKVSSAIFIVKDFHEQIGNSPTSNITIPAHVSKNWGADLDGDSVHMNFKWTPAEVKKKEWRGWSNEFFDKYVQLISQEKRQKEITADISFENDANNAIAERDRIYGVPKSSKESQLTPWGDAQMFEDNVPAKHLVGMVAALQRSFNIFSNTGEKLPFSITLKGESKAVTRDRFFDDSSLENGAGNWFGVAQLLNIVLDNAKHQFASKLGLDMQSVFPYVLLRRLGYSLNDLAVLFNSPIVKEYMEFKRSRSKNYISKDSDIKAMFLEDQTINFNELVMFLKKKGVRGLTFRKLATNPDGSTYLIEGYNTKTWNKLADRIESGIDLDINKLAKRDKTSEIDAVLMLYALSKFNQDVVRPFSKAFTVHQKIEKNPIELKQIRDDIQRLQDGPIIINEKERGGLNLTYELGNAKSNNIVNHAMDLFNSVLERATKTDIRFTPYMQSILNDNVMQELNQLEDKSKIINQIIIDNLKQEIIFLNRTRSRSDLIKEFQALQERYGTDNYFLSKVLEVTEKQDKVVINRAEITEFTSYKAIAQIKDSFGQLTEQEKNLIFELEAEFNGFGFTGGAGGAASFVPFFDDVYVEKINAEISRIIQDNQNKTANLEGVFPTEYTDAKSNLKNKGKNLTPIDKVNERSKQNNSFQDPTKKAKKIITPQDSHNTDYLRGGVRIMSFPKWVADKGIDIKKIEEGSKTYKRLYDRYNGYREDFRVVQEFEATLEKKPLSKYTLEGLYDLATKFRKMDNAASKGIAYTIEKEIGQRAFKIQSEFLKKAGIKQGYKYNIPGEDGVPQEDLTNFQAWLGSNDMTSKRPEIQYLINEAQTEYRKYLRAFSKYKNMIEGANRSLVRSKMKGLTILERVRKGFDTEARYQYIYGNIATIENGNIRLLTEEELADTWDTLTKQERNYYTMYKSTAEILLGNQEQSTIIPGMQMGTLASMSRSGLFGLYNTMIDTSDYNRVKVYGTDKDGKRALKTFYEWKYDIYKGRTGKISLDSGREIYELDKLRRKAKQLKTKGKHEDGSDIMLSDAEYDGLVDNGSALRRMVGNEKLADIDAELIQEYERRQGVRAQGISYDINTTLLEFARSSLFMHGENTQVVEDGFAGMGKLAILTDSIIAFNKGLDNKNAVQYLTKWWKEGFLEKKEQEGVFGKTGDKVIDFFVRLTSLRLLGFNMSIGVGNILAGKYQELRKRGGAQFVKGEKRYWMDHEKSWKILKDNRIIQYSFDEFIHLSEKQGAWGKLERWSYVFMDKSEAYIQGSAFLGMLTDEEYANYRYDEKTGRSNLDEERVMYINHKIATLHGEGYTALDANMLAMYSYGRALLQFKKWFVTLIRDRFKPEDINRFGEVNIGSYRAASEFTVNAFRKFFAGEMTMEQLKEMYDKSSPSRKKEIVAYINGLGLGITLLSLIAIMEDDDEPDTDTLRRMKKLSHDIFATTDLRRFVDYRIVPSSYSTINNATRMIGEAVRGDKVKRTGPYGKAGTSKAMKTARYDVGPGAEFQKDIANIFYSGPKDKKETSSLIR